VGTYRKTHLLLEWVYVFRGLCVYEMCVCTCMCGCVRARVFECVRERVYTIIGENGSQGHCEIMQSKI